MAYDDDLPLQQGAPKASEIAMDRSNIFLNSPIHANLLKILESNIDATATSLSRSNYILTSNGLIQFNSANEIRFDYNSIANDIELYILQTEHNTQRTFKIRMQGSTTTNDATHFLNLPLANNELIYLEIDKQQLLSSGGTLIIENAINGGSIVSGKTAKKINVSTSGMPQLLAPISSGTNTTFYIPLALRIDVLGVPSLWWIPHGIRWPQGVASVLGAVTATGINAWPQYFVDSEASLLNAIVALGGQGGVICINGNFTIGTQITIPNGVIIVGRGPNGYKLTFNPSGRLVLQNYAEVRDLKLEGGVAFGTITTEWMIEQAGVRSYVRNCLFTYSNTSGVAEAIRQTGTQSRADNNKFVNVNANHVAINNVGGGTNTNTDSLNV